MVYFPNFSWKKERNRKPYYYHEHWASYTSRYSMSCLSNVKWNACHYFCTVNMYNNVKGCFKSNCKQNVSCLTHFIFQSLASATVARHHCSSWHNVWLCWPTLIDAQWWKYDHTLYCRSNVECIVDGKVFEMRTNVVGGIAYRV